MRIGKDKRTHRGACNASSDSPSSVLCTSATLVRATRSCAGFTLLEVMITTMLLSIGFLGLSAMSIGTIQGLSNSANISKATALAREQLERIENADYDTVIADNYPQQAYNSMAGFEQFQRTVTITDNVPQANAKMVTVAVARRNSAGVTRTVTLSTIIMP